LVRLARLAWPARLARRAVSRDRTPGIAATTATTAAIKGIPGGMIGSIQHRAKPSRPAKSMARQAGQPESDEG
jgi:hypothetical protein